MEEIDKNYQNEFRLDPIEITALMAIWEELEANGSISSDNGVEIVR